MNCKLQFFFIPLDLHETIKSFLKEQTFHVRAGSDLGKRKTTSAGVPQGVILTPTLNIYCHDLPTPTDDYRHN